MESVQGRDAYLSIVDTLPRPNECVQSPRGPDKPTIRTQYTPSSATGIHHHLSSSSGRGAASAMRAYYVMIAQLFAQSFVSLPYDLFRGTAERDSATKTRMCDRDYIKCHVFDRVGYFDVKCPILSKHEQQANGQQLQNRGEDDYTPRRQHQRTGNIGRSHV